MSDDDRREHDFEEAWNDVKREFRSYLIGAVPKLVTSKPPSIRERIKRSLRKKTPFWVFVLLS